MFKSRRKEQTAEDAPDSIAPWEMLSEADGAVQTARLQAPRPGQHLVAFARRLDADAVACFDKGPDGAGKAVLVLENPDAPGGVIERRYAGFGEWFDSALAEHAQMREQK